MEKLKVALHGIAFVHRTLQGYDISEVFLIFACNIEKGDHFSLQTYVLLLEMGSHVKRTKGLSQ